MRRNNKNRNRRFDEATVTRMHGFNKESDGYIMMLDLLKNNSRFIKVATSAGIDLFSGGNKKSIFKTLHSNLIKVMTPKIIKPVVRELNLMASDYEIESGDYNHKFAGILALGIIDSFTESPLDTELIRDLNNSKLSKLANDFSANRGRKKLTTYLGKSVREGNIEIEDANELYNMFGSDYPYASDLVAYFIFGNTASDNEVYTAIRNGDADESELSEFMLDYEYSWQYNMDDIEDFADRVMNESVNESKLNEELDIKVDSIFKRGFYWVADNKDGKILASAKTKAELMKDLKQAAKKGLVILESKKSVREGFRQNSMQDLEIEFGVTIMDVIDIDDADEETWTKATALHYSYNDSLISDSTLIIYKPLRGGRITEVVMPIGRKYVLEDMENYVSNGKHKDFEDFLFKYIGQGEDHPMKISDATLVAHDVVEVKGEKDLIFVGEYMELLDIVLQKIKEKGMEFDVSLEFDLLDGDLNKTVDLDTFVEENLQAVTEFVMSDKWADVNWELAVTRIN
jgi:hypothetical protein